MEVAAGDQVKRSSRRRRKGRIDKEKPSDSEEKTPPPPARGKEEEGEGEGEEGRLLDEEEAAQDRMRSFRLGWEECFHDLYGSFEDNIKFIYHPN